MRWYHVSSEYGFFSVETRPATTHILSHTHSCYELVYFTKTNSTLTMHEKAFPMHSGDLYFVYPHTEHTEQHFSDGNVIFIGFECDSFPHKIIEEKVYTLPNAKEIYTFINMIVQEATKQQENYSAVISHLLAYILLVIERTLSRDTPSKKSIDYACNYISEYFNQAINFHQLASTLGYSPDYFRHIFTQKIGVAPKQFQINIRLTQAAELLAGKQMNCTDVVQYCGFSTSAQFTKMFKKQYNMSPKQYRDRHIIKT